MSGHDDAFHPSERVLRQFAGIWVVFFGAAAAWQEYHHHRHLLALVLAILAVTVGPLGVAWPRTIRPVFVGWMALVAPVGWTISRVVLGALFYGLFSPVAWIFRLIGRDELRLKRPPSTDTYWGSKPRAIDKAQYLRQF